MSTIVNYQIYYWTFANLIGILGNLVIVAAFLWPFCKVRIHLYELHIILNCISDNIIMLFAWLLFVVANYFMKGSIVLLILRVVFNTARVFSTLLECHLCLIRCYSIIKNSTSSISNQTFLLRIVIFLLLSFIIGNCGDKESMHNLFKPITNNSNSSDILSITITIPTIILSILLPLIIETTSSLLIIYKLSFMKKQIQKSDIHLQKAIIRRASFSHHTVNKEKYENQNGIIQTHAKRRYSFSEGVNYQRPSSYNIINAAQGVLFQIKPEKRTGASKGIIEITKLIIFKNLYFILSGGSAIIVYIMMILKLHECIQDTTAAENLNSNVSRILTDIKFNNCINQTNDSFKFYIILMMIEYLDFVIPIIILLLVGNRFRMKLHHIFVSFMSKTKLWTNFRKLVNRINGN